MKKINVLLLLAAFAFFSFNPAGALYAKEKIQLAILLDTSSSMDGLINQARSRLWSIVNSLSGAKQNGNPTMLEVALYEYGNNNITGGEGFIRMVTPLTSDLDLISEELFRLSTNGGSEYCGQVIDNATRDLAWSTHGTDLKIIFIAGNEPFTQGSVSYQTAINHARTKGITVNTIHCGSLQEGIRGGWKSGADTGGGKYLHIDHNLVIDSIAAPQDAEILSLGKELNKTYLAYGIRGESLKKRQEKQDLNAASVSEDTAVSRSAAKASGSYKNHSWDLVDALSDNRVTIESVPTEELPVEMKKMSPERRKQYIATMSARREMLQKKISRLNAERTVYVEKEMKKRSTQGTLDRAVTMTVREQAGRKGIDLKN